MKNLSAKWQKLIVWLTGYLNIIAFFLAGGYIYLNTEDEDIKTSAKTVLALTIGFTAIDILRSVIYNVLSLANVEYQVLSVISDIGLVFTILKAVAFVTLCALDLAGIKFLSVKNGRNKEPETTEKTEQE